MASNHKISDIRFEPMPLPEPRAAPPYTLDANCEWVLDADSKICWIPPADTRRGNRGHFGLVCHSSWSGMMAL